MAITEEDIKRLSIWRIDTGPYYCLFASFCGKMKVDLVAVSKNGKLVYKRASSRSAEWKWEILERTDALGLLNNSTFVLNRIPKKGIEITEELIRDTEKEKPLPKTLAVMVGNIVDEREFGEDHHIVHGTKQFSPGTKVYCRPVNWGIDERWKVTGIPKCGGNYITVILSSDCVTNLRTKIVYSPKLIEKLVRDYVYYDSKEAVEDWIKSINEWRNGKKVYVQR